MKEGIRKLKGAGIRVSLFIDPDSRQIKASQMLGAEVVELHTGSYANANAPEDIEQELARLHQAALKSHEVGLQVNAGHGLNYHNTRQICQLPHLRELHIGHSIISRSVFTGISEAVREMLKVIRDATPQS
jgi:pyridoxine 5-phosphate synthase